MTPLVSILIPCYNAERYVAAAIQSALDQTWPNKEIIVVDDASIDGSGAILDSFCVKGVRVIHERFGNASSARNRAFKESTGEFIKFFDADDLLEPRTIELQMERLAGSQTAVASAEWGRFYGDDLATFKPNPQSVWRDMNSLDWLVETWMDARPMMQPGMFLIPRAVLGRSGLWNEKLTLIDDFEFYARVLCHASEVRFTPGAKLYYRSGLQGSLSSRKSRAAVESAFDSVMSGTAHLLARRQDEKARLACANLLQDFIYTYYPEHGDLRKNMEERIEKLGGSSLPPSGPPRFEQLRRIIGWKLARRVQRWAGH
ncbi:MAG TPA: glycosyltransferase family 2 protein [Verrucomicrobiae bacterium]|nr:glycosyltransferase family 2 protein [Verrucomicrobiae bacterium]